MQRTRLLLVVPTIENGEELGIRVYLDFLLFVFTQNQVPQIMIGRGSVIYHIKVLSVVIRANFKNFENFFIVEKNRFEIFNFWSNFELLR